MVPGRADYLSFMEECEALIQRLASSIGLNKKLLYRGQEIDLAAPWDRIPVHEAFRRYAKISVKEALERNLLMK